MRTIKKKPLIIIAVVAAVILIFVLLTTVGKPLLSKSITAERLDDFKNVCYNDKIVNDDPTCPSYVVYDKISKETAKAPDRTEMIEAIEAFVGK